MSSTRFRVAVASVAALGLTALGAASASAAPSPHHPARPDAPTVACEATNPGVCVTPVVAQSVLASHNLIPADDAGMTAANLSMNPGTKVTMNRDADLENGTQDWTFIQVDTVPVTGSGAYTYTAFDNAHYAGAPVFVLEYTPFGQDSGECLQPTVTGSTIQDCDGGADQAIIVTPTAPGVKPAPAGYFYALSVQQALTVQHHKALTVPKRTHGAITLQRLVGGPLGKGTNQLWSETS